MVMATVTAMRCREGVEVLILVNEPCFVTEGEEGGGSVAGEMEAEEGEEGCEDICHA